MLELFRVTDKTARNGKRYKIGAEELRQSAAAYDPKLKAAPLVIGHPKDDSPAFGWLKRVDAVADLLTGEPTSVAAAFAEAVNAKAFPKISMAFYPPDAANNPKPGVFYPRHVGFFGGQQTIVDGLLDAVIPPEAVAQSAPAFADENTDDIAEFELEYAEPAGPIEPKQPGDPVEQPNQETKTMTEEELQQREAEIAARENALKIQEDDLKAREIQAKRDGFTEYAEGLASEAQGKILPRHVTPLVEFFLALPDNTQIEFAEEGGAVKKEPTAEWFQSFLDETLGKQIEYGEISGHDGKLNVSHQKTVPGDTAAAIYRMYPTESK